MSIFVAIASYRDARLWRTIQDCLAKASDPRAITFGVLEQAPSPSAVPAELSRQVSYIHVHQQYSRGVCWARAIVNGLYRDEDFLLQIDSHMQFAPDWDRTLIASLEAVSRAEPRAVISTYPFAFEEIDGQVAVHAMPGHALVLRPRLESDFEGTSPVLIFEGVPVPATRALEGFHIAAGCMFTRGAFVDAVPYDARLYFHGEEQNLAIRAWTQGWNLYHIPDMPIFHLYKRPGTDDVHWNAADEAARPFRFFELRDQSAARMHDLLVSGRDLGRYGLGSARSLADFASFSGIDYRGLKLRRIAGHEPLSFAPPKPQNFFRL